MDKDSILGFILLLLLLLLWSFLKDPEGQTFFGKIAKLVFHKIGLL